MSGVWRLVVRAGALLALHVCGFAVSPARGEVILAWEYPSSVVVDSFLVSYQSTSDPGEVVHQFRVLRSAAATCEVLGTAATPDMVCARPPSCLPPGVYTFSVQAERGKDVSAFSNWFTCRITPDCRATCEDFAPSNQALADLDAGAAPAETLPRLPPPVQAPDRAPLEALEAELARLHALVASSPAQPPVLGTAT